MHVYAESARHAPKENPSVLEPSAVKLTALTLKDRSQDLVLPP